MFFIGSRDITVVCLHGNVAVRFEKVRAVNMRPKKCDHFLFVSSFSLTILIDQRFNEHTIIWGGSCETAIASINQIDLEFCSTLQHLMQVFIINTNSLHNKHLSLQRQSRQSHQRILIGPCPLEIEWSRNHFSVKHWYLVSLYIDNVLYIIGLHTFWVSLF
jgi:hypothetical protein